MNQDGHSQSPPPTNLRQPPIATTRRRQPSGDPTITIFFIVIFFLLLLFFFFILSPSLHIPKIIESKPVKANWNSFIIFLSVLAIFPGLLAQINQSTTPNVTNRANNRAWESYRDRDRVWVNADLRRGSSSCTDSRQKRENGDKRMAFADDFGVGKQYSSKANDRKEENIESVPNVPESNVQRQSTKRVPRAPAPAVASPPRLALPPPAPQPATSGNRKHRRGAREPKEMAPTIAESDDQRKRNRRKRQKSRDIRPSTSSVQTPPPPPPPPPPLSSVFRKMFKKGRKTKTVETVPPPTAPPPAGKTKRFPSSSSAPPRSTVQPPSQPKSEQPTAARNQKSKPTSSIQPPSPPSQQKSDQQTAALKHESKRTRPIQPKPESVESPDSLLFASTNKPPLPTKSASNYHRRFLSSGSEESSSSSSIPPPPPPPPCKVPALKFELRGHFARLLTLRDSDFSSPDRDELRSTTIDGGDSFKTSLTSSSDVNVEADRFISKHKDEWKTQKKKKKKGPKEAQNNAI